MQGQKSFPEKKARPPIHERSFSCGLEPSCGSFGSKSPGFCSAFRQRLRIVKLNANQIYCKKNGNEDFEQNCC